MPRFRVNYVATASHSVVVEAENENDAMALADDEADHPSLCAQCAGWNRPGIDIGDWEPDEKYPVEEVDG